MSITEILRYYGIKKDIQILSIDREKINQLIDKYYIECFLLDVMYKDSFTFTTMVEYDIQSLNLYQDLMDNCNLVLENVLNYNGLTDCTYNSYIESIPLNNFIPLKAII